MGRPPCCEEMGLKKGPWTPEEDQILTSYIHRHGHGNWRALPKLAGLMRCGKSCRLRWINYLRPDIKRGNFTKDEEDTIVKLHHLLGNRWSAIAARLPGRTDNEIKNFWHTNLKKRSTDQAPPPPAVTVTTPTSRNTNLQIIVAQQDDDDDATITNTTYNNYYHQTQRELPQSCDDQTIRASNKQQQFDKLLVELEQHKHIDDENHMDFWYSLFVKSDPHDHNNDHHLPSSTHNINNVY